MAIMALAAAVAAPALAGKGYVLITAGISTVVGLLGIGALVSKGNPSSQDKEITATRVKRQKQFHHQVENSVNEMQQAGYETQKATQAVTKHLSFSAQEFTLATNDLKGSQSKLKAIIRVLEKISSKMDDETKCQFKTLQAHLSSLENTCENLSTTKNKLSEKVSDLEDIVIKHQEVQKQLAQDAELDKEIITDLKLKLDEAVTNSKLILKAQQLGPHDTTKQNEITVLKNQLGNCQAVIKQLLDKIHMLNNEESVLSLNNKNDKSPETMAFFN